MRRSQAEGSTGHACCLLQVEPGTARKSQTMSLEDRAAVIGAASMAVDQLPPGAETDRLLALQQKAQACARHAQQLAARAAELGVTQYSGSVSTASLSSCAGEEADGGEQHPSDAGQSQAQQATQEQLPPQGRAQEQLPAEVGSQMQLSAKPGSHPIRLHLQAAAYIPALLTASRARANPGAKPAAHAAGPLHTAAQRNSWQVPSSWLQGHLLEGRVCADQCEPAEAVEACPGWREGSLCTCGDISCCTQPQRTWQHVGLHCWLSSSVTGHSGSLFCRGHQLLHTLRSWQRSVGLQ